MSGSIFPKKRIADDYPNLAAYLPQSAGTLSSSSTMRWSKRPWPLSGDTATAEAILKRYNSYNLTHPTYKALAEVRKAEKSILYLPSQETQHKFQEGLNVVKNWNATNDFIYGRQGLANGAEIGSRIALKVAEEAQRVHTLFRERVLLSAFFYRSFVYVSLQISQKLC